MTRSSLRAALVAFALSIGSLAGPTAQRVDPAAALRQAMDTETVRGDVVGAIAQYKALATSTNRAVAAQALLRLAGCYEKTGETDDAHRVYDRIVRDFAEQRDAVTAAHNRLLNADSSAPGAGLSERIVWTLPAGASVYGNTTLTGQFAAYVDRDKHNDLFLHDFRTGADHQLTFEGVFGEFAETHAFSRDSLQIAYAWFRGDRYELRTRAISTPARSSYRQLFRSDDVKWMAPFDWSPDGRLIAVAFRRDDNSAGIGVLSTADGSLHILKSLDWRGPSRMSFSPDGRYLAYDAPAADAVDQRDVYVIRTDATSERPAIADASNDLLIGWSPRGDRLLFSSDRSGSVGLWSIGFADGRTLGAPELLKKDLGAGLAMNVSPAGAMLYAAQGDLNMDVQSARFDAATGAIDGPRTTAAVRFLGTNWSPAWSPDGQQLAFISRRGHGASQYLVIGIRAIGSEDAREIVPNPGFQYLNTGLQWTGDGRWLVAGGRDAKGRGGVFRIDTGTGRTSVVTFTNGCCPAEAVESKDGARVFYRMPGKSGFDLIAHDSSSGVDKVLLSRTSLGHFDMSPAGDDIAVAVDGTSGDFGGGHAIVLVPVHAGAPREIARDPGSTLDIKAWAPDGESLIVARASSRIGPDRPRADEMIRVGVDGTVHAIAGDLAKLAWPVRVSADGHRIAFVERGPQRPGIVWLIEKFLPPNAVTGR
jgi:Tol biopolymer transport system component